MSTNPPPPPSAGNRAPGAPRYPGAPELAVVLRRVVVAVIYGYTGGLWLLYVAMGVIGERWWPLAVALYFPQGIFLLPLVVLVPAALLAEVPGRSYAVLGACGIIFLWHVPFYPGIAGRSRAVNLKLITNNYGQNHGTSLAPYVAAEDPDFVALEDVAGQAAYFRRAFPDRTVSAVGQFILLSKGPVKSARPLAWPLWRGGLVAAVYEVAWQGEEVAIYTVHFPSPRSDLAKLAGAGLVRELAGRNRRRSDNMSFGEAMRARVELAQEFASVLAREQRPYVALGDFNMPSNGYVHHIITGGMTDCFAKAGRGFGFTFPWDTHNPLTLGQGWLRIDYVLAGPGWSAGECRVEPGRWSQHRAVEATLNWK